VSQLALDAPRPSAHRVEALAGVLAGFLAPGYKDWSSVPKSVKKECRATAEEALVAGELRVEPVLERLRARGS
jgi:hypothetical protein